jgi:hypothetical protein
MAGSGAGPCSRHSATPAWRNACDLQVVPAAFPRQGAAAGALLAPRSPAMSEAASRCLQHGGDGTAGKRGVPVLLAGGYQRERLHQEPLHGNGLQRVDPGSLDRRRDGESSRAVTGSSGGWPIHPFALASDSVPGPPSRRAVRVSPNPCTRHKRGPSREPGLRIAGSRGERVPAPGCNRRDLERPERL